jgi:Predicted membrane protein
MSYESVASDVVKVIEGFGGAIMVVGGLIAFGRYAQQVAGHASDPFRQLRANLGRVILLGLEVLIIADIIRTILVDQSLESVGVLGLIVLIRIVLSFSLEVEIDGAWPWNGWRLQSADRTAERAAGSSPNSGG